MCIIILIFLIGDKSTALAAAEKKRSQYPMDYAKNKQLKTPKIIEKIEFSSSSSEPDDGPDEPAPYSSLVNEKNVSKPPTIVHSLAQTTTTRFCLF